MARTTRIEQTAFRRFREWLRTRPSDPRAGLLAHHCDLRLLWEMERHGIMLAVRASTVVEGMRANEGVSRKKS